MKQQPLVEDIQTYAQNIVDTVREPLLILDATLRVRSANRAFYQTFKVSPGETEGRLIYELGNGQWDIPDLRTLLLSRRILRQGDRWNDRNCGQPREAAHRFDCHREIKMASVNPAPPNSNPDGPKPPDEFRNMGVPLRTSARVRVSR